MRATASAPVSTRVRGDVEFDDVWFEYDAGVPVLRGVSFAAPAGHDDRARGIERVGQEHAHQPGHGLQPADGGPGRSSTAAIWPHVRLRDYRAHLGVVLQDNFLFDGTVAENIRYARPEATP